MGAMGSGNAISKKALAKSDRSKKMRDPFLTFETACVAVPSELHHCHGLTSK